MFDVVLLLIATSIIFQCIILNRHQEKWWKGLIPGYNKYMLGKICEHKKIGLVNAILVPLTHACFIACYFYEVWIIKNYAVQVKIPLSDTEASTQIQVIVPQNVANIAIYSKYALMVLVFATLIFFGILMWFFTVKHQKSRWWVILWAFLPVIPFGYFAFTKTVYINGEILHIKKVMKYERT